MADQKITDYTAMTAPALADLMEIVDDPGGTPASQKITLQNLRRQLFPYAACGFRMTLTTGTPVTTADVTGATTLYITPYSGSQFCGQIGLYDGSAGWDVINSPEISLTMVGLTASKPHDIFVYNNSGTLVAEAVEWTNATTRATALTVQDGVYVKTGATTRRYLGTIYVNSSGGQTDDSAAKRNVWNYYNRTNKKLRWAIAADTNWTYDNATWRAANNDASYRVEFVVGVSEDVVEADLSTLIAAITSGEYCQVGFGLDITNGISCDFTANPNPSMTVNFTFDLYAKYNSIPAPGFHFLQYVESVPDGPVQFYQYDAADANYRNGISGCIKG